MLNRIIASWFGIGYMKGGGTIAAAITCIAVYFCWQLPPGHNHWLLLLLTAVITFTGIYTGNQVEPEWGKDSYRVVIDEVAGMLVTMLFVPQSLYLLVAGFILFRFFDILKPLFIRKMESLPGGTGVMMDDILAGIYANLLLQAAVLAFKLK